MTVDRTASWRHTPPTILRLSCDIAGRGGKKLAMPEIAKQKHGKFSSARSSTSSSAIICCFELPDFFTFAMEGYIPATRLPAIYRAVETHGRHDFDVAGDPDPTDSVRDRGSDDNDDGEPYTAQLRITTKAPLNTMRFSLKSDKGLRQSTMSPLR